MGTFYQVKILDATPDQEKDVRSGVEERLETVNRLMSNWKSDSDVSRFNILVNADAIEVDPHTAVVVRRALEIAGETEGAFEPTLGPLIELWGFGAKGATVTFPSDADIEKTAENVGYQHLTLDKQTLGKSKGGVQLNLSALAKGYAVDLVHDWLVEQGHQHFLVNVGGDGRVKGLNASNKPWRMAIEAPDSARIQGIYTITEITDVAMATSGDYRIFFEHEGVRYSHLIDPRTGRPIPSQITSVSIIAPDCMTADAYATALSVLSPEEGIALVEKTPDVECFLIIRDEVDGLKERKSSGMDAYLAR